MNPRRGHESTIHLEAKTAIGQLFNAPNWSVFYEQRNADILVMHNATRFVAAIEVESSPRNVLRNLDRNFAYGCQAVAVISLTERYLAQITVKVLGHIATHPDKRIKVFLHNAQGLHELLDWLTAISRSKHNEPENNP